LLHDIGLTPPRVWQVFGLALFAMSLLMIWQAGDLTLAIAVISGTLITLSLLLLAAWGLISALNLLRENAGVTWRFGLANLARRAQASSVQLAAFGLGIMAMLLLAVVRVDLLDAWQSNLAQDTPNHFAVNIQPADLAAFKTALANNSIENTGFFPMAVGRFVAVNDQTLNVEDFANPRAQRMLERTFNLSSGNQLSPDNKIVTGEFWQPGATGQVSVEVGFAELFDIQLGDVLHFRVGGQAVQAEVSSLRSVQWDSFNVNFFVLGTPDLTEHLPRTYVTSFYLADTANEIIPQLIRQFPAVTIFDLNVIMHQVRSIMERATLAVQYVFLFTLLAGIMVLYAAISASQDERLYESALLRTLGATKSQVLSGLLAEFTTLGLLAGLLAATMAALLGAALALYVFELPYHFNVWLWIFGILGGGLGVGLAGILGTYHVLNKPPLTRLRMG
jgi:putative ABC transport system permease protein